MDVVENSIWTGATPVNLPAYAIAPQQPSSTQGAPQVAPAEAVTATTPSTATPNVGYNLAPTVAPTDTSTAESTEGTIALSGVGDVGGGATAANNESSGGGGDGDGEARMKEEVMAEGGEEANDGRSRPAKRPRDAPPQVCADISTSLTERQT